jgi:hypothetical protein
MNTQTLRDLKLKEEIISMSYWENWSFHKTLAQALGGTHPRAKMLEIEINQIREEWHTLCEFIKEIENKSSI